MSPCETHDEKTLTGAGDQQDYRQDYNAPILLPNDITAVNLQDNWSKQVALKKCTYE
jgi:hypothetical protein